MMYYTDAEIYHSIQRGNDFSVLAQLNGCPVAEIKEAYHRHESIVMQRDQEYKQRMNIAKQMRNNFEKNKEEGKTTMTETKQEGRKSRFSYTDDMVKSIQERLSQGMKPRKIYNELFEGVENAPSIQAFTLKCKKMNIVPSINSVEEKIESNDVEGFESLRRELRNKMDEITKEYKKVIFQIAELDIEIRRKLNE